jgi:3',5'-cyclic-AMP phosphodiesterase
MPRIVQLTDLHLTSSPSRRVWGSDVWRNLRATLACIRATLEPFDFLVLTGDLANQRRPETYQRLRETMQPWADRLHVLPGNHDDRELLRAAFPERLLDRTTLNFLHRLDGLVLIGLDSSRPWRVHGRLGTEQLAWLDGELRATNQPTMLFVHHPPIRVGTWWLDKDLLRDHRALAGVLATSCVKAVVCGHVHQPHQGRLAQAEVWTSPSTAYQFRPHAWLPGARSHAPSFRVLDWDGGEVRTHVVDVPPA